MQDNRKKAENADEGNEKPVLWYWFGIGILLIIIAVLGISLQYTFVHKIDNSSNSVDYKNNAYSTNLTTAEDFRDTQEEEAEQIPLSGRDVHYDTGLLIPKEKAISLRDTWLGDLSPEDREYVEENILRLHWCIESDLINHFYMASDISPDSEAWGAIIDLPDDNVNTYYGAPEIIDDLRDIEAVVDKESFSAVIDEIIFNIEKVEKKRDFEAVEGLYQAHQELHDLSYWAINYPLPTLDHSPPDWHGIFVYFGTLDDIEVP